MVKAQDCYTWLLGVNQFSCLFGVVSSNLTGVAIYFRFFLLSLFYLSSFFDGFIHNGDSVIRVLFLNLLYHLLFRATQHAANHNAVMLRQAIPRSYSRDRNVPESNIRIPD